MRSVCIWTVGLLGLLPIIARTSEPPKPAADELRIGQLITLLGSKNFQEREQAAQQLISIGKPAEGALKNSVKNPDPEIARRAQKCLEEIPTEIIITKAIENLRSPMPRTRIRAAWELLALGPRAKSAVPHLMKALDDEYPEVRLRAAEALAFVRVDREDVIRRFVEMMNNDKEVVQIRFAIAAHLLPMMGKDAECAVPALLRLARTGNRNLPVAESIPSGLADKEYGLRSAAYTGLARLGKDRREVIPFLLQALKDQDPYTRSGAAWALGEIGKEPVRCVPAILKALELERQKLGNDERCSSILCALSAFGPAARAAIPAIFKVASDAKESLHLRANAVQALQRIGPDAKESLVQLTKRKDQVARHAYIALIQMGQGNPALLEEQP